MNPISSALALLLAHDVAAVPDTHPAIDIVSAFPLKLKYKPRPRTPAEIEGLRIHTVHVTDVRDGFSVVGYQIAPWRKRLQRGNVPADLLAQLPDPRDIEACARQLALLERYSHEPYHDLWSRKLGDIRMHAKALRTSHGDAGGNEGVGWAADCSHTEQLEPTGMRRSLRRSILETHEVSDHVVIVVGHRAWSGDRLVDPDRWVWSQVVRPVVDEIGERVAVIGYNTRLGSGRPVPRSWDDRALFDDKGRRIAA